MQLADSIRAELARSDEEILKSIGQALGRGAISGDPIERAKEFIANITDQLRNAICSRPSSSFFMKKKPTQC
jgi:hypothetical protein